MGKDLEYQGVTVKSKALCFSSASKGLLGSAPETDAGFHQNQYKRYIKHRDPTRMHYGFMDRYQGSQAVLKTKAVRIRL